MSSLILEEPVAGIFVLRCTYEERSIAKGAGLRWHPGPRCRRRSCPLCGQDLGQVWWTDDVLRALELCEYAASDLRERLEAQGAEEAGRREEEERVGAEAKLERLARQRETIEAGRARDVDLDIPSPEGLEYLPYQKVGISFALGREHTLIADEMGLGKTVESLGVVNADPSASQVLVVCPASLKLNWLREAERWLCGERTVGVAGKTFPAEADIVIINYDILAKWSAKLRRTWDVLIVDECHYVKNKKAKRSKRLYALKARRRLFLTGTPVLNRPAELWAAVSYLAPEEFPSFWAFAKRYCKPHKGRYGWDFNGSANLAELHERLCGTIMIRRTKADVLDDLPPKRRQVIELASDHLAGLIQVEESAWREHERRLARLRRLTRAPRGREVSEEELRSLREGVNASFGELAKLRQVTALAKVPLVVEHLRTILDDVQKVVVFAHHRAVIAELAAPFEEAAVTLTGGDGIEARQAAVDRFQEDDSCRVFVGSIMAAGLGLTLTAASHVVFAELAWVPAHLTQAEDRTHRIGQTGSVLVQHLVLQDSLDARMVGTLLGKQDLIDRVVDGESRGPLFQGSFAEALIDAASAEDEVEEALEGE